MRPNSDPSLIHAVQARFRRQIAGLWNIPPGARVLEVGCGQGDMTVVLAEMVGRHGHVTAIDPAGPDYGAPETLGDATKRILKSPLGNRIHFRLGCDLLADLPLEPFDLVIFAHSSWYFDSVERLGATLRTARRYAPILCLSEWDLQPRRVDQLGHMLAVQIQGMIAAFDPQCEGNIRTPMTRPSLSALAEQAGWRLHETHLVDDPALQDSHWEIQEALAAGPAGLAATGPIPPNARSYIENQISLLRHLSISSHNTALGSFAFTATHGS